MDFLGLGFGEVLMVVLVALLVFGPEKVPEIARGLGRTIRSFKQAASGFTTAVTKELDDVRKTTSDVTTAVTKELDEAQKTTSDITATMTRELDEAQKSTADLATTLTKELDEARKGLEPLSKPGSDVKLQETANGGAANPVGADNVASPRDKKDISGKNE